MTTRQIILGALAVAALIMLPGLASAQTTVIYQQPQTVVVMPQPQTVIVNEYGQSISTCYHNCYHQPHPSTYRNRPVIVHQGGGNVVIVNGQRRRPRSSISFGIGVTDHRGSGFSFGFTEVR